MKLQTFEGGVSSRLAPQLIDLNQGVVYENIDNTSGILNPVRDKLATTTPISKWFTYFRAEDAFISSPTYRHWLEFQKTLYSVDGTNRPTKYKNGVTNYLGIERPTSAPTLVNTNKAPVISEIFMVETLASGDFPYVELQYAVFNVKDGLYTAALEVSITTTNRAQAETTKTVVRGNKKKIIIEAEPTNRGIVLSNPLGPVSDSIAIFRAYEGVYRLVTTTTPYVDNLYDISGNAELDEGLITPFLGTYQYVYTYYNSTDGTESAPSPISDELEVESGKITVSLPSTSTDPQVTHKRLYRVGGDIAQFTLVAELSAATTSYIDEIRDSELEGELLESDNYYEAPSGLDYLTESYAMLFGALGSTLRFTPIAKPNAWPPEYSIEFAEDITGIGPVANGILVMTETSTYIVTGTGPLSLASQLLRGDQGCIANSSIQEALQGVIIWASQDGLCMSSGNDVRNITKEALGEIQLTPVASAVVDEVYYCLNSDGYILAWDYRFKPIFKWLTLGLDFIHSAQSLLYGHSAGLLYKAFKADNKLTFKYKSPRLVEGSSTLTKIYKKFYFRSDGDIIINIIIDDDYVVTNKKLSGKDTFEIQVPQHLQRGYYTQIEIEGTGEVLEIEYRASSSRDG